MTVKVVRGLVQTAKPTASQNSGTRDNAGSLASRASTSSPQASEAAINSIRGNRGGQALEKIRDSKEARSVANSVAQGIFTNEAEANAAHSGLSSNSAQGVL
jgi:hypothetical protein